MVSGGQQRLPRNQADELASRDAQAQLRRFFAGRIEDLVKGRHFVIRQIDRNLRAPEFLDVPADGATLFEAARDVRGRAVGSLCRLAGLAERLGDRVGEFLVSRVQVDVVRDQELARSDDRGAGSGVESARAEVGGERRILELFGERLVLPLADVGQRPPLRARRCGLVEVDGYAKLVADTFPESFR